MYEYLRRRKVRRSSGGGLFDSACRLWTGLVRKAPRLSLFAELKMVSNVFSVVPEADP